MDKVKNFLEAYVQWLALALAVAFLGWTVYGYVVQKPVTATVGSSVGVAPGDINNEVWTTAGNTLDDQMHRTDVPPNMMPTVDYPAVIAGTFSEFPSTVATDLKNPYVPYWTPLDDTVGPDVGKDNRIFVVLPTIPNLVDLMFSKGHSNVQPPAPPAGAPATAGVIALDKLWITVGANLPVEALSKSFADAKIPSVFSIATVYRVVAEREEMDASGNWVNKVQLETLDINPMTPLPAVDCNFKDRQDYKTWAETQQNVVTIVEPPFYTVLQGDVWYEPGFPNPNDKPQQNVVDPFDPQNPLAFKGDPNSLLPEERAAYDKAKQKQADADARRNRANTQQPPSGYAPPGLPGATGNGRSGRGRGGPGGGAGGGAGGGNNAVPVPQPSNPGDLLQQPPNHYRQPYPGYPGGPGGPGGPGYNPAIPRQDNPAQPASSVALLPQGSFSPADRVTAATANGVTANIKVWVHDTTVQAGKTYHYRLKYVISNPVAGTTNLCKDPADSQKAWIQSDFSPWGDSITVDSDSNFYAVDAKHGIRFDIFKWKNGLWQKQTFLASIGDRIGKADAETKTDFDTGWTLVDIREDPAGNTENKVLVLVSDNGTIKEKEIATDRLSSKYRQLLGEVQTTDKTASR